LQPAALAAGLDLSGLYQRPARTSRLHTHKHQLQNAIISHPLRLNDTLFDVALMVDDRSELMGDHATSQHIQGMALSPRPAFGQQLPYRIVRELPATLSPADQQLVLHTLPLPLPCSNYPMLFAPAQQPLASQLVRPSYAFHQTPIPDLREQDGRCISPPITLGMWVTASGPLNVQLSADRRHATFELAMTGLIPDSLYTVMSLRQHDLHPAAPTRPGPLGVPNVFMADAQGRGH